MSAFEDWLEANKLKDDITLSADDYYYTVEFVGEAFNAGRESLCSQRESYLRGHRAGRAYQRDVDAALVERNKSWKHELVAMAIMEQKIDD